MNANYLNSFSNLFISFILVACLHDKVEQVVETSKAYVDLLCVSGDSCQHVCGIISHTDSGGGSFKAWHCSNNFVNVATDVDSCVATLGMATGNQHFLHLKVLVHIMEGHSKVGISTS